MKSQETLGKIMELLNLQDEVKLESMKLENGTVIEAEAFEPNQEVFIVTEDERIALPIGEYEMEDGRILVVAEEGVIAEIGEAKEEEAPQEEAPADEPAQEEEVEQAEEEKEMAYATKEELTAAMDELKGMIDEIKSMMSPKEEEMSEEVVEEQVEMSTDEPAAKPIKHNPDTKTPQMHKFAEGARKDTLSRIFDKLG